MNRCRILACTAAFIVVAPVTGTEALAEDYPLKGLYGVMLNGPNIWQNRQDACLASFYTQSKTGVYVLYHVDKNRLLERNELSYLISETGQCSWDGNKRIETCQASYAASEDLGVEYIYYHGNDVTDTGLSMDDNEQNLLATRSLKPQLWQLGCLFDLKSVSRYLSDERTHYGIDDVAELTFLPSERHGDLLDKIRSKLKATSRPVTGARISRGRMDPGLRPNTPTFPFFWNFAGSVLASGPEPRYTDARWCAPFVYRLGH